MSAQQMQVRKEQLLEHPFPKHGTKKHLLGRGLSANKKREQSEQKSFMCNLQQLYDMCGTKKAIASATRRRNLDITIENRGKPWNVIPAEEMRKANNAHVGRVHRTVNTRVSSGNYRPPGSFNRRHFISSGQFSSGTEYSPDIRRAVQCDVLGSNVCTHCTKIKQQETSLVKHDAYFPDIEMNSRFLVAPMKLASFKTFSRHREPEVLEKHELTKTSEDLSKPGREASIVNSENNNKRVKFASDVDMIRSRQNTRESSMVSRSSPALSSREATFYEPEIRVSVRYNVIDE